MSFFGLEKLPDLVGSIKLPSRMLRTASQWLHKILHSSQACLLEDCGVVKAPK